VFIVCEIVGCPSISRTTLGSTFFGNNSVAHVRIRV
jgi:hypothetical protein